ncbi:MAG: hypothetical protein AAF497_24810 [Planctomycetota bacterium]
MNLVTRISLLVLITLVSTAVSQDANCWENEDGDPVVSPVDMLSRTTPELVYEADTGIVYIDTLGLNGIIDTTSDVILGDDVGMISVILEAPQGTFIQQNTVVGGVVWTTGNQFYSTANNTMQMVGTPVSLPFLQPTDRFELFQLAAGLTAVDFDQNSDGSIFVEIGVNYSTQTNPDGTSSVLQWRVSCRAVVRRRRSITCV